MPVPNYLVIGAAKAGSTTVSRLIGEHPDGFMSRPKELRYFSFRHHLGWDWYLSHFQEAEGKLAIGDGSPEYTLSVICPDTPRLIRETLPEVRLVYIVRHPIERLVSHYAQDVSNGFDLPEFNRTMRERRVYVDGSLYWKQIQRYRRLFSDDQLHVMFLDDLKSDPVGTMKACYAFLGLDPDKPVPALGRVYNARDTKEQDRALLAAVRHTGLGHAVNRIVPRGVKRQAMRLLRKPLQLDTRWDRVTLEWCVEDLADDTERFLAHYGGGRVSWDLDVDRLLERPVGTAAGGT